jgi:hypothetical protein
MSLWRCEAKKRRSLALAVALALVCAPRGLHAADTAAPGSLSAQTWLIAAAPFEAAGASGRNMSSSATLIPSYILDQLSGGLVHRILPDEKRSRLLRDLQTQQQAIFLELTAAVKQRDGALLSNLRPRDLKKAIQSAEVKIKEVTARIDAKTLEIRAVFPEYGANLSVRETRRSRRNAVKVSRVSYAPELVALWKGDAETLFTQFRGADGTPLAGV